MESADPVERKWACVAVSNLIYNDPSTRRLLQGHNVVGTLIGRLTDSEEEVIVEAAGALRCVSFFCFLFCCAPELRFTRRLIHVTETCALTVDMKLAQRCTTRTYSHHWRCSYPKYVYVRSTAAPSNLPINSIQKRSHRPWRIISTRQRRRPRTRKR